MHGATPLPRKAAKAPKRRMPHVGPPEHVSGAVIAGTALAGAALWGLAVYLRAKRAERNNPPVGQFLDVDGVRVHVLDRGTGTPVVLLHGNGSMIQDFVTSGLVDRLANRHRVVVLDRPGFGYSARPRNQVWSPAAQAKLFHAVLNRLGVEKPVIVGHSWGTLPAIELGLQHPTEVRGLVLLSGHYYPTLRLDVAMLSPPALPIIGDLMRYTISPVVGRVFARKIIRKLFAPARVPPEFAEFPIGMALRPSQIRSSADETALLMPVNGATHEHYRTLKMPVAILAGAEDRIVASERQSRRLHAELPHSELRLVPNAGHMIHHTASAEVLRAIDEIVGAGATPK